MKIQPKVQTGFSILVTVVTSVTIVSLHQSGSSCIKAPVNISNKSFQPGNSSEMPMTKDRLNVNGSNCRLDA
jgi:hypothetical protein